MDTATQAALALLGRLLDRGLIPKETWAAAGKPRRRYRGLPELNAPNRTKKLPLGAFFFALIGRAVPS